MTIEERTKDGTAADTGVDVKGGYRILRRASKRAALPGFSQFSRLRYEWVRAIVAMHQFVLAMEQRIVSKQQTRGVKLAKQRLNLLRVVHPCEELSLIGMLGRSIDLASRRVNRHATNAGRDIFDQSILERRDVILVGFLGSFEINL